MRKLDFLSQYEKSAAGKRLKLRLTVIALGIFSRVSQILVVFQFYFESITCLVCLQFLCFLSLFIFLRCDYLLLVSPGPRQAATPFLLFPLSLSLFFTTFPHVVSSKFSPCMLHVSYKVQVPCVCVICDHNTNITVRLIFSGHSVYIVHCLCCNVFTLFSWHEIKS